MWTGHIYRKLSKYKVENSDINAANNNLQGIRGPVECGGTQEVEEETGKDVTKRVRGGLTPSRVCTLKSLLQSLRERSGGATLDIQQSWWGRQLHHLLAVWGRTGHFPQPQFILWWKSLAWEAHWVHGREHGCPALGLHTLWSLSHSSPP